MNTPLPPPPGPPPMPGASSVSWTSAASPATPVYASFWQRLGALLIDGLLLAPLWAVPLFLSMNDMFREFEIAVQNDTEPDIQGFFGRFIWWGIAVGLLQYAYNAVMVGRWNATIGKMALGIRVRRTDGSPATWREALLRPLLPTVGSWANTVPGVGFLTLLDYLWMLWDQQKQTIHDKIASTIVVTKDSPLPPPRAAG